MAKHENEDKRMSQVPFTLLLAILGGMGSEASETARRPSEGWVTLGGVRYFRTSDIGELTGKGEIAVPGLRSRV